MVIKKYLLSILTEMTSCWQVYGLLVMSFQKSFLWFTGGFLYFLQRVKKT